MKKRKSAAFYLVTTALLLFTLVAVLSVGVYKNGAASASGVTEYSVDEYLTAMNQEQITEWFERAGGNYDTAYVLRYIGKSDIEYSMVYEYAVYVPCAGKDSTVGIGTAASLTGPKLALTLDTDGQAGDVIYCITLFTDDEMDFMVSVDGKKVDAEIVDTDISLTPPVTTG